MLYEVQPCVRRRAVGAYKSIRKAELVTCEMDAMEQKVLEVALQPF